MANHNLAECRECYFSIPIKDPEDYIDRYECEIYENASDVITDIFSKCYSRVTNREDYRKVVNELKEEEIISVKEE